MLEEPMFKTGIHYVKTGIKDPVNKLTPLTKPMPTGNYYSSFDIKYNVAVLILGYSPDPTFDVDLHVFKALYEGKIIYLEIHETEIKHWKKIV
jgi:hypothetical protein